MKLSTNKILATIATLSILVAAGVLAFVYLMSDRNSDTLADADTLANGTYQDYFIWCEKTNETVKYVTRMGSVTSTYELFIFRCTATAPGGSTEYELNLEPTTTVVSYVQWLDCDDQKMQMQGDIVIDDTEYDIVIEETLSCVVAESDSL